MAERLVAEMTEDWDPEKYHDEYRSELLAFMKKRIKRRARAGKLAAAPEPEEKAAKPGRGDVIDIAEALKRSLARTGADRRRSRRRKSA